MSSVSLTIAEEVVLLGLDEGTGRCVSTYAAYTWAAGLLAELVAEGRLNVDQGPPVVVRGNGVPAHTGDPLLDRALDRIAGSRCPLEWWIRSGICPHGRDASLDRLVQCGVLERVENKILGLFTIRRYPAHHHDASIENAIRSRLRALLFDTPEPPPDLRTRLLLSVVARAGLLRTFVTTEERRRCVPRLQKLTSGEPIGDALGRVIEEDESVVTAVAIAAST